jgi:hypothetical protein
MCIIGDLISVNVEFSRIKQILNEIAPMIQTVLVIQWQILQAMEGHSLTLSLMPEGFILGA